MDIVLLVLRLLHVAAGIFWVGAALLMNFFIGPSIQATLPAGQQFSGYLMTKTRFKDAMTASALITVIAGTVLYLMHSQIFSSGWTFSGAGIGFGIGGVFGILGAIFGAMFGSLTTQMALIGTQIKGQPSPDQLAEMQSIQKRIKLISPIHVASIILSTILMSVARYLVF
jgi:uncharacterized membrane protein